MLIDNFKQTSEANQPASAVIAGINRGIEHRDNKTLLATLRECGIYLQNGPIL